MVSARSVEKKPNLNLEIELEVRDRDGNVLSEFKDQSRSLLRNFALILRALMAGNISGVQWRTNLSEKVTLTDVNGESMQYPSLADATYPYDSDSAFEVSAPDKDDNYGIWVGGGTAPVTRDDYTLEAKIPHGQSTGELYHGKTTVEDVDGDPPDSVWRVIRTFTNEGDTDIVVREIGLVARCGKKYVMIARDVLSTPQTVPVFATLTVRYVFTVTA